VLAAADFVLWVGVILLVGFVGFFVVAVVMVMRLIGFVARVLFGRPSTENERVRPRPERQGRLCPRLRCGHVNAANARYCARCGQPLGAVCDVDAYG
jgi:hypothetical protein